MSIPTAFDGQIAELSNSAQLIILSLRTLHYSSKGMTPIQRDRRHAMLRETLQEFADRVLEVASEQ